MRQVFRKSSRTDVLRSALSLVLGLGATLSAVTLSSCVNDPVRSAAIDALGDEVPGYPEESQYHRPGQPCGVCHESRGPGPKFMLAGTVFWGRCNITPQQANDPVVVREKCDRQPVDRAEVRIIDATKSQKCFYTNCAGNFHVREGEWAPTFPLLVTVSKILSNGQRQTAQMGSHIGREVSCNACHDNPARPESPGQIFLFDYNKDGKVQLPAEARALKCPPEPPNVDPPKECPL
jgi:hypothetical protein